MQWLKFDRLRWQKGRPETAEYHCEGCEQPIAEHHKTAMLERGEWRATATAADPTTAGYHLSALYSPVGWLSWQRIARAHEAARGSDEAMRAFRNTILGETWVETGEAPDWQRLADRREAWAPGKVPAGGLFLTAGADVQKDRVEVDVWAWGRGLESWLVDHVVIEGGPGDPACWQQLTDLLGRTWAHESGQHLTIARLAVDTGYETSAVYGWARQVGFAQVAPVKGLEGFNRATPVTGPTFVDATVAGKRLRRGARLWSVATSTFKAETYRFLRLARPTEEDMADGGHSRPARCICRTGPTANGSSSSPPSNWSPCAPDGASPSSNGKSCASATRRWTAGSMPAPPPGSRARIAGRRPAGRSWNGRWRWRRSDRRAMWPRNLRHARPCVGGRCGRVTWGEAQLARVR
jgi:phage terminase large subunit GpA-like protein